MKSRLMMGITPDPDDAFAAYALVTGRVLRPGLKVEYRMEPIETLNRMVTRGEIDVAAISSVLYPHVQKSYAILRAGASVGRGYGPRVAARGPMTLDDLAGKTVAVPGATTTGATLLRLFQPAARTVSLPLDEIRLAVLTGKVDAGVLIHEELLNYAEWGLQPVCCLGHEWLERTGLPLPVGLNVLRRDLPGNVRAAFGAALEESIRYALGHPEEAFRWALRYGRSPRVTTSRSFTEMFANQDTLHFGTDCEQGLRELFHRLRREGLAPAVAAIEFVETRDGAVPEPVAEGA